MVAQETTISELSRILVEFSDAHGDTNIAKQKAVSPIPYNLQGYVHNLRTIFHEINDLLRDYRRAPQKAEPLERDAADLCYAIRTFQLMGKKVETQHCLKLAVAAHDFLNAAAQKSSESLSLINPNSFEKLGTVIARLAIDRTDVVVAGAYNSIQSAVKTNHHSLPLIGYNAPIAPNDMGFLDEAARTLKYADTFFTHALKELGAAHGPEDDRIIKALSMLPDKTLSEYAPTSSESSREAVANMLMDVRKSVALLRGISTSKVAQENARAFETSYQETIRTASGCIRF